MELIHFCGGLPRSGSTILMNILQQNPQIFTTSTCALYDIIKDKLLVRVRQQESFIAMSSEQADIATYGLIQGGTKGWFEALTDKPIVISKRHGWSSLLHLYPQSKFICVIRDLRDIVESFERVNHKFKALHTYNSSGIVTMGMHWLEKFKYYFGEPNSLSVTLNHEIPKSLELYNQDPRKVLFIRYEDFTADPNKIIKVIYKFLDLDYFNHNLNKIDQSFLFEHDHSYFREKVSHETYTEFREYSKPNRILDDNFHNKVIKENKWYFEYFYPEVLDE
jgi:hypothetical protein